MRKTNKVMQIEPKTYLQFISFSNLLNWSVQYYLEQKSGYSDKYDLVEIGSFLSKNRSTINIEDDLEYTRVTVKIKNGGVCLRDIKKGCEIGTKKQFIVLEGQFIISKIDARNGAMGIIPANLSGAVVTNDFPVYDIDTSIINPQYFVLIITTDVFLKFAQSCSTGTTNRQRIDMKAFLKQRIPLPTLEEQNILVEIFNSKIRAAEELQKKADDIEKEIEEYLYEKLEIREDFKIGSTKKLSFVNLKQITRWDVDNYLHKKHAFSSSYCIVSFNELFISLKNGVAARNYTTQDKGIRYIKVSDIKDNNIVDGSVSFVNNYPKSEVIKRDTLLITRKGTVGQSFYTKKELNAIPSSEIFIIKLSDQINGDYFSLVNMSSIVKKQYKDKSTGTIMPSLSQNALRTIKIPLPPISLQEEIVYHIQYLKNEIKSLQQNAIKMQNKSIIEFENKIFE